MARAYVGTSGWNYPRWKDDFYAGVPQKRWLRHCAERFTAVEANATFYRLQTRRTFESWNEQTPDDFAFALKGHRFLTHNKKLSDPEPSIRLEREGTDALGRKLAAIVWQLQRRTRKNLPRLRGFLEALDALWPVRHAFEFRHTSWFDDEVADCLREHQAAVCLSDAADWPMWDRVTANFVYVRLHGHTRTYVSAYSGTPLLRQWARRTRQWLEEGRDVHVYFDNDGEGAAPWDAMRLLEMVRPRS